MWLIPGAAADGPVQLSSEAEEAPSPAARGHGRLLVGLALAAVLLPALAYVAFVHASGVSVPFKDEWNGVSLYRLAELGRLTPGAFWTQENESRMVVSYGALLLVYQLSALNTAVEMLVSAALLLLSLALSLLVFRSTAKLSLLWAVPAAFLFLSLDQWATSLQGFALAIYLGLFLAVLAIALLLLAETRPHLFYAGALAAAAASFCTIAGLVAWPAGLIFLMTRGRPRRRWLLWFAFGIGSGAVFAIGYHYGRSRGGPLWVLQHPLAALQYLLLLAGSILPSSKQLHLEHPEVELLGAVLLLCALGLAVGAVRSPSLRLRLSLPLSLAGFGLVVDILVVFGRGHFGLGTATSSRYTVYNLWLAAGVWLGLAAWFTESRGRLALLTLCGAGAVWVGVTALSYHYGLHAGSTTHAARLEAVRLLRHYPSAPPSLVSRYVNPSYAQFERLAAFLSRHRLSVFSSGR